MSMLSGIATGDRMPRIDSVAKLARALGVSPGWLAYGDGPRPEWLTDADYTDNNVTAWAGKYYNSLKLLTDTTTVCLDHNIDPNISTAPALKAACTLPCLTANFRGVLDTVLKSYVSADGISYSTTQLEKLRRPRRRDALHGICFSYFDFQQYPRKRIKPTPHAASDW